MGLVFFCSMLFVNAVAFLVGPVKRDLASEERLRVETEVFLGVLLGSAREKDLNQDSKGESSHL